MKSYKGRKGLRLGAYLRVSRMGERQRGAESFHAEHFQDEDVFAWAEANGHHIVKTWPELNVSGAKWERAQFQEVLDEIGAGELDGIIVAYLSRFARTMKVGYKAIERIEDAGGVFISVQDNIDLSTTEGINTFNMKMTLAEAEWRMKRDGFLRVQQDRIAKGIPMRTCFGYARGPERRLIPHQEEAPWVPVIFGWRVEGLGYREIAIRLNKQGAPPPSAKSKRWSPSTVGSLLQRRTYLGEVWHDASREYVTKGAHEPLIDEVTFALANAVPTKRKEPKRRYLLSGLLRCAGCRSSLAVNTGGVGGAISYYCKNERAGGDCQERARATERQLVPVLRREFIREANLVGKRFRMVQTDSEVRRVRAELEHLEAHYQSWLRDEDFREIDPGAWREGAKERKAKVDARREELSVALKVANTASAPTEVEALWPDEPAEQRKLLQAVFQMVFLRSGPEPLGERVHVIPKGAPAPQVPVPGKVFDVRPFVWDHNPLRAREPLAEDLDEGSLG